MLSPSGDLSNQLFFPEDTIIIIMGLSAWRGRRRHLKARVTGKWKMRQAVPKWAEGMANYEQHAPRLFLESRAGVATPPRERCNAPSGVVGVVKVNHSATGTVRCTGLDPLSLEAVLGESWRPRRGVLLLV